MASDDGTVKNIWHQMITAQNVSQASDDGTYMVSDDGTAQNKSVDDTAQYMASDDGTVKNI